MADRVVLLNRGRVEQIGTADQVYECPASPFVYSFLGAANVFHGRVEGAHVRVGESTLPHDGSNAVHGADVVSFAHAHELDITTDLRAPHGLDAMVRRVLAFGGNVRVELDGVEEATAGVGPSHYEVLVPRERARTLTQGQRVRLVPVPLRVFQREAA